MKIYCHDDVLNNVGCLSPRNCICQRRVSSLFPFVPSRLLGRWRDVFHKKIAGGSRDPENSVQFAGSVAQTEKCRRRVVDKTINSMV